MIAIVDYDVGNVGSVLNMLAKVGAKAEITRDAAVLRAADKLVLPGVGAFRHAVDNLRRLELFELLDELVTRANKPILGICLGAQLMTRSSEEGDVEGFGWLDAKIIRFRSSSANPLRIPHMGWNRVEPTRQGIPLFDGVPQPMRFYFVHSYHMVCESPDLELATTEYGYRFASVIGSKNIVAMQCHPEKSHKYGLQIFRNFAERFESC